MRLLASPVPIRMTGEGQSPLPTLRPEKVSPKTDTSLPFGAVTDAPRSAHVTPQRPVRRAPARAARLPGSTWTPGTCACRRRRSEAPLEAARLAVQGVLLDGERQRPGVGQRERDI